MEEHNKDKMMEKMKKIGIVVGICTVVLAGLILFSAGMYKYFYANNKNVIDTMAENNSNKNEKSVVNNEDEIQIELINPENLEETDESKESEETEKVESEEKEEETLTEEEKKKLEEERKKQDEERKKREEENRKQQAQKYPYYIKVNYTANTVTIYSKDANGNYTVPVKAMVCSTGAATPTSGVYKTPQKAQWGNLIGSYGQYCTRITGQILFHSVPYLTKYDKTSLEYWEYDRLGETRSLGCIRLTVIDAKWIFDNCPLGTSVEFYASSNPGPLGKPSAPKIGSYESPLKNWDPTDPDPNNPWKNYNETQAKKKEEEERKAEEEAKKKAEEEAKKKAEEEAKKKAEEEAKKKAEAEAKKKAEEEAKKKAEEEAKKKAEEEAKQKAEEEAKQKQVVIPNVVGKKEDDARRTLIDLKLNVTISYSEDLDKPEGVVISQSDNPPGKVVPENTVIKIVVNKLNSQKIN